MLSTFKRSGFMAFVAVAGLACGVALAQPKAGDGHATASPSGKSLVVPEEQKKLGTVYFNLQDQGTKVTFDSDAPMEKIKGTTSTVVGYAIAGKADSPAKLQGGEWHLAVNSIKTGNPMRDGHLQGKPWLDAESFPFVCFKLTAVKDVKEGPAAQDGKQKNYTATLVGDMTIHGVTKPMTVENAAIRFRPTNELQADMVAQGELLQIRAKYKITLSDFGVKHDKITKSVANTIDLDTELLLSTVPPEDQKPPQVPKKDEKKDDAKPKTAGS